MNHHQVPSQSVCPACSVGFCRDCEKTVRDASICPACDSLCVKTAKYEEDHARARQRARPLKDELGTIVAYPLRDPMAFVMLALFTWLFGVLGRLTLFGGIFGIVFSQGVLMGYCFYALSRVAGGNLSDFMPDFGDLTELLRPLRLGLAALAISSGPLLLVLLLVPALAISGIWSAQEAGDAGVVHAASAGRFQPAVPEGAPSPAEGPTEEEDVGTGRSGLAAVAVWLIVLVVVAFIWKVVYTPVALTVAGLSGSVFSTLNPLVGIDTIRRMGSVYWQAMLIYTVLAAAQWVLDAALSVIPLLGRLAGAFVDAYAYLAIGCTLGLAVFKKGPELGWD